MALNDLRILYMEDDEHDMVKKLAKVSSGAAKTFDFMNGNVKWKKWKNDIMP